MSNVNEKISPRPPPIAPVKHFVWIDSLSFKQLKVIIQIADD